jgi:hypothetical protein
MRNRVMYTVKLRLAWVFELEYFSVDDQEHGGRFVEDEVPYLVPQFSRKHRKQYKDSFEVVINLEQIIAGMDPSLPYPAARSMFEIREAWETLSCMGSLANLSKMLLVVVFFEAV